MFKKILQSLSKSQQAKAQVSARPSGPLPVAPSTGGGQSGAKVVVQPSGIPATPKTAEELCEVTLKMPRDQIANRLKLLYRRYNRGASSLDPKVRAEADRMLDAIVVVREKVFGEI